MFGSLVLAFSLLLVPAGAPGQTDTPRQAKKQSIQGKVIEAKSGLPVRKVSVEVIGGSGESGGRHAATTAADGTFTIEDLLPGRYRVTLERAGLVEAAKNRAQMAFTLEPGQSLTGLVFRMQAAGVISGRIVDSDGDAMAGVSVNATMGGTRGFGMLRVTSATGTSNDLGEYRIADLRPGKYLVSATPQPRPPAAPVERKGKALERMVYTSTYYPGTVDRSQAIEVAVRAGEETSANFAMQTTRTYRVSGIVTGAPTGATIEVFLAPQNGDMGMGMENIEPLREGQRFEYANVAPGKYVAMMIVVKGIVSGPQPEVQMVRLNPSIQVDKADLEGLQFEPEPGGQIHGGFRLDAPGKFDWSQLTVSLLPVEENEPEPGVEGIATARAYSGMNTYSAVAGDGTFELKNVPGGTYQLLIGANSDNLRDYYAKQVIVGGRNVADSGFVVNGDMYLDVLVSAKGASVEGTVVDSKDKPVPYAMVAVVPNSEHRARPDSYQQSSADEHGHFAARGLTPGSYVVLAFEELESDVRRPEFLETYGGKGEKLEVEEGSRKSVTVKVIPADAETQ